LIETAATFAFTNTQGKFEIPKFNPSRTKWQRRKSAQRTEPTEGVRQKAEAAAATGLSLRSGIKWA